MHCYECPYTSKIQRKYGVTTHCNLEPTNMDVSFYVRKKIVIHYVRLYVKTPDFWEWTTVNILMIKLHNGSENKIYG